MSETNFFCCFPVFNKPKNKLQSQSIQTVGNFTVTVNVTIEPISKIDNIQLPLVKINLNEENKKISVSSEVLNKSSVVEKVVVQDLPVVVQELPVVIKDLPDVVQELPVVIQDLPVVVQELPVVVQELPVVVQDLPVVVQELPVIVQDLPVVVKELPVVIQDSPFVIQDSPVVIQDSPVVAKDLPDVVQELPIAVPVVVQELPVLVEESPVLPVMIETSIEALKVPPVEMVVNELVKSNDNKMDEKNQLNEDDDIIKKKGVKAKINFVNNNKDSIIKSKRTRGKKIIL
jgi:hypothetical protein